MARHTRHTLTYDTTNQGNEGQGRGDQEYPTGEDRTMNQGNRGNVLPYVERKVAETFLRQNPLMFTGTSKPGKAEEWLQTMDRIFRFLECFDRERILCVSFQLKGLVDFWWEL